MIPTIDRDDTKTHELLEEIAGHAGRIAWWTTLFGVLALAGMAIAILAFVFAPAETAGGSGF